jgi:uncharacterized membrane-anchored protein YhcB (DUF1043 family)
MTGSKSGNKHKKSHPTKKSARGSPKDKLSVNKRKALQAMKLHSSKGAASSLEKELISKGYMPMEKVIIREKTNDKARYIKSMNKLGQTVFIDLDSEGTIQVNPQDITLTQTNKSTMVPYSAKMGTMNCLDLDICGVAFECSNGICTLQRDIRSTTPVETTFTTVEDYAPKTALVKGSPVAYPIVRLSEIRNNDQLVLKTINKATRKLRNDSYGNCIHHLRESSHLINNLSAEYNRFIDHQRNLFKSLSSSIESLEDSVLEIDDVDKLNSDEKEVYALKQYNLKERNDYVIELLKICQDVSEVSSKVSIKEYTNYLHAVNKYLTDKYGSIKWDFLFKPQ